MSLNQDVAPKVALLPNKLSEVPGILNRPHWDKKGTIISSSEKMVQIKLDEGTVIRRMKKIINKL